MSRFTTCPGLECQAKIKVVEAEDGTLQHSFCCLPCWEYTWEIATTEDAGVSLVRGHSNQCWDRQADRIDEPLIEGSFAIHAPLKDKMPPSRLGGPGARTL